MERREHKRRRFWLPIQVDGLPSGYAVSHDASDHGLLLVSASTLEIGSSVQVTLRIPPTGNAAVDVNVTATVVRVAQNDEDPDGLWPYKMGVRFEEPVGELEAYLARLSQSTEE